MDKVLLVVSLAFGGLIAYVDSRPNWDDTGITAADEAGCGSGTIGMCVSRDFPGQIDEN